MTVCNSGSAHVTSYLKTLIMLSLAVILVMPAASADTIVQGRVVDVSTDSPIIGASLELIHGAEVLAVGDTDLEGRFMLQFPFDPVPEQQTLLLRTKKQTYATSPLKVVVTSGRPDLDAYHVEMIPEGLAACPRGTPYLVTVGRFFDPPSGDNVATLSGRLARALSLQLAPELQKKHLPQDLQLSFVECTSASPHSLAHLANYAKAVGAQVFIAGDVIESGARFTVRTYFGDRYGVFPSTASVVNEDIDIRDPGAVVLGADTYAYMLVALTHGYVEKEHYAACVDICVAAEQLMRELLPDQVPPRVLSNQREFCQARTANAGLLP